MKALIFQGLGKKVPKNRNEAAKQLRAGLEPCFKLRLIIPIETPGVIDDFRSASCSCRGSSRWGHTSLPLFVLILLWLLVYAAREIPNVGSLVAPHVLAPRGSFGVAQ